MRAVLTTVLLLLACGDNLDGRTACEIHADAVCSLREECLAADFADCHARSVATCEATHPAARVEIALACEEIYAGVTCETFRRPPIEECDVWR
jgi:hypothetical protein